MWVEIIETLGFWLGLLVVFGLLVAGVLFVWTWIWYRAAEFRFNRRFLKNIWLRALEFEIIDEKEKRKKEGKKK